MSNKETIVGVAIVGIIFYAFISGLLLAVEYDKQLGIKVQAEKDKIIQNGKELEQHKFLLKETKTDSLISGSMKGSFLLASGSIYGEVTENKYLNVVYFDDDKIIDNTTDVYRITKFDLETIQIVTIPQNETPYYKYVENSWQSCEWGELCDYKLKTGTTRLYLSEGWAILNN